jgi:cell division protein FtsB
MSGGTEMATDVRRTQGAPPGRRPPRAALPAERAARPGRQRSGPRSAGATAPARGRPAGQPRAPRTGAAPARVPRTGAPRTGQPSPASSPWRRPDAAAARMVRSSRTPFIFLVIGLLGGGLLCLLLINTILDAGAFQITRLQQENVTLAQQTQELQAQVASAESPSVLAARARLLGMHEPSLLHFLNLGKDRIQSEPTHEQGVLVIPPGYTP